METKWRLIQSGYNDAFTNMAIDEAIFLNYESGVTRPTLRIYGWQPAAFSLGYFQDTQAVLDLAKCEEQNIAFVRRITGGQAIFHHRELTYSLVCSAKDIGVTGQVVNSFKVICSFIMATYRKLGLAPSFAIETHHDYFKQKSTADPRYFCFASKEKYDILIQGRKIGGNAQKRRKEAVFQHGSIPLESDIDMAMAFLKEKPVNLQEETISLEQAIGRQITIDQLQRLFLCSFEETFGVRLEKQVLRAEEAGLAESLKQDKYASREWNVYKHDDRVCQKAAVAQ